MVNLKLCSFTATIFFVFSIGNIYSQVSWVKNSGSTGKGSFTISGSGSVASLNSNANIAFLKHGSGSNVYYTCNSCTINLQITGQLTIDYPLYITNSRIIVGKTGFANVTTSTGITVLGSSINPKQALFLDNSSSIQLSGGTNFIKLQNSPVASIYLNYQDGENTAPSSSAKKFSATDVSSLCGVASPSGSTKYTCNKGQANGPSVLSATGFNVIAALPVVLVDFSAQLNNNKTVDISWSTQMEVNLSHFIIERSADGSNWEPIGTVQAIGNSQIVSNYSFVDHQPLDGLNYYRLQMTDLDNKYGFTQLQLIRTPVNKLFKIFPNPAKNYVDVTLSKNKNGVVKLIGPYGQILQQKYIEANNSGTTVNFQLSSYTPGNYYIQVIADDGTRDIGRLMIEK